MQNYPVTIAIIAINALFSIAGFNNHQLFNRFALSPAEIRNRRQYERFVTSGFLHADYLHLLFNMFTLFFFGQLVEQMITAISGEWLYAVFYLVALVVADIPSYIKHRNDYNYRSIGASGAVSAVIFASILLDPWAKIYIYVAIPIPAIVYAVLYIFYCIYAGRQRRDNINHDAHLWGGIFGFVCMGLLDPSLFQGFVQQLMHPGWFH